MPTVTNANINAPVVMIAERGADMILGNDQLGPEPTAFYRYREDKNTTAPRARRGAVVMHPVPFGRRRAMTDYSMFIGGEWVVSESGARFPATSPSSGETIGTLPEGTRADAQRAIVAANTASERWARLSAFDRRAAMRRIARGIDSRRDELARVLTLDQGKPLRAESDDEVAELITYFEMAGEDATRIEGSLPPSIDAKERVLLYRVPRGVVGVISPWNWPYTMPAEILAPVLAAGNTVVWAPAPSTSVCAVALADAIVEADLPPGVLNLVTGPGPVVGDEIAANPGTHAVGFVGSTATGISIAQRGGRQGARARDGGQRPSRHPRRRRPRRRRRRDADRVLLERRPELHRGELILVAADVHDEYVAKLSAAVSRKIRLGDPFDDETTMGPLNNPSVVAKTEAHVKEAIGKGASLVTGGQRANGFGSDLYFEPTVIDGIDLAMTIAREETFGPVAPVAVIESEREAIDLVNHWEYGLLSAVFTGDLAVDSVSPKRFALAG